MTLRGIIKITTIRHKVKCITIIHFKANKMSRICVPFQITKVILIVETLGITTNLSDVIYHMILIGSHFSEAARGSDGIHKCMESPQLVKLEYAVNTIRAM